MTSQHDKPKRWRPRFSVRTLVIVVTLVCVYFGLWLGPTMQWGEMDVYKHVTDYPGPPALPAASKFSTSTIAPLIVDVDFLGFPYGRYFWFFGVVVKLPMETPELDEFIEEQRGFLQKARE